MKLLRIIEILSGTQLTVEQSDFAFPCRVLMASKMADID